MAGILPTMFDKDLSGLSKGFGIAGSALQGFGGFIQQKAYADASFSKAKEVIQQATWQSARMRRQKRQQLGSQALLFARAGVEMSGTAKDIQDFTEEQMEVDIKQMWTNANAEAKALKKAGKTSKLAGTLNLVGSLL
jgi:flagellar motor component MotA